MACAYDSCELAAASEFRTAFFDCSKSGSRSIDLARERLFVFFRRPILTASCAAFSMVIHLAGYRPERRFRGVSQLCALLRTADQKFIGGSTLARFSFPKHGHGGEPGNLRNIRSP
jgi:hypothetical protein